MTAAAKYSTRETKIRSFARAASGMRMMGMNSFVTGRIIVANPLPVPRDVAVCPECNGKLWWQVTTSDGLRDLDLDCRHDTRKNPHRNWQGEWEGIYAAVRRWIRKTTKGDE